MSIYDLAGRSMLTRRTGHALFTIRPVRKFARRHVLFEIKCTCEETRRILARAAAISDCGDVHRGENRCWKFRPLSDATALVFEPGLVWKNHFTTTEQWEAVP